MSGDVALVTVSIVLCFLSLLAVALRSISRFAVAQRGGVEDGLVIFALCCSIALATLFTIDFSSTAETHDLPDTRSLQVLWASMLVANIGIPTIKISILWLYLNFFIWTKYRNASWMLVVGVAAFGLAAVTTSIFACLPIQNFWLPTSDPQCINFNAFTIATASWDVLTNILILLLPMFAVARWAQPTAERWAYAGMYGIGLVACIASGLRFYGLHVGDVMRTSPTHNTSVWLSTTVEFNLLILCASLPTLGPLLDHCFPGFLSQWWWCDSTGAAGRRPSYTRTSYTRTWLKLTGRDSPQPHPQPQPPATVELQRNGSSSSGSAGEPPRAIQAPSALSQTSSSSVVAAPPPAAAASFVGRGPAMVSVTTNNRGSAHPGALVVIPEDLLERGEGKMPSRLWVRDSWQRKI